jgi:hypothetical protein
MFVKEQRDVPINVIREDSRGFSRHTQGSVCKFLELSFRFGRSISGDSQQGHDPATAAARKIR